MANEHGGPVVSIRLHVEADPERFAVGAEGEEAATA